MTSDYSKKSIIWRQINMDIWKDIVTSKLFVTRWCEECVMCCVKPAKWPSGKKEPIQNDFERIHQQCHQQGEQSNSAQDMPRHYAVQAAQTLNVDTAVPQYRHSYIIGSGIVNHHRIIRFECKPNRWNCWKRKRKNWRRKGVNMECICAEKQSLIH